MMPDTKTENLEREGGARPVSVGTDKLPNRGIVLLPQFVKGIISGRKQIIVKSRPYAIFGKQLILSKEEAFGIATLSQPKKINLAEFRRLKSLHQISEETRKKVWPEKKEFYAYKVMNVKVFAEPIPIDPVRGPFAKNVVLKTKRSPTVFELSKAEADSFLDFAAWLRILASKSGPWVRTTLRFTEGPPEAVRTIKAIPTKLASFVHGLPVGGRAELGVPFPAALETSRERGKALIQALKCEGIWSFVGALQEAVDYLDEIEAILEATENLEDDPIVRLKGDGDAKGKGS